MQNIYNYLTFHLEFMINKIDILSSIVTIYGLKPVYFYSICLRCYSRNEYISMQAQFFSFLQYNVL